LSLLSPENLGLQPVTDHDITLVVVLH
jgi:hypothetical protein